MSALEQGEDCETFIRLLPPAGAQILCEQQSCTPGCVLWDVTTNAGYSGQTCGCDIVGPPAICCKSAWVESLATYQLVGNCSMPSCVANSTCRWQGKMIDGHIYQFGSCLPSMG